MKQFVKISIGLVVIGMLGCTAPKGTTAKKAPAKVGPKDAGNPPAVALSQEADHRLGITTVRPTGERGESFVPASALLYDVDGSVWIYVRTAPLTYQRMAISLLKIEGATAKLGKPLPAETEIVSTGAAELFGTETGGGK